MSTGTTTEFGYSNPGYRENLPEYLPLNHTRESSVVSVHQPGKMLSPLYICTSLHMHLLIYALENGYIACVTVCVSGWYQQFVVWSTKIQLTPVLELYIRLSCPVVREKDIFRFPGPTSTVLSCGLSAAKKNPFLLFTASLCSINRRQDNRMNYKNDL